MTPFSFTPASYSPALAALLVPERLPDLGPGSPNLAVKAALEALDVSPECRAGLWLLHDFLDESHAISQDLETKEGSFWHAILHRREPDAANSKYWWRLVGSHPVLDRLREQAPALGYEYATPEAFVEECERVRGTGTEAESIARRVQLLEWQLLFDWCVNRASRVA